MPRSPSGRGESRGSRRLHHQDAGHAIRRSLPPGSTRSFSTSSRIGAAGRSNASSPSCARRKFCSEAVPISAAPARSERPPRFLASSPICDPWPSPSAPPLLQGGSASAQPRQDFRREALGLPSLRRLSSARAHRIEGYSYCINRRIKEGTASRGGDEARHPDDALSYEGTGLAASTPRAIGSPSMPARPIALRRLSFSRRKGEPREILRLFSRYLLSLDLSPSRRSYRGRMANPYEYEYPLPVFRRPGFGREARAIPRRAALGHTCACPYATPKG